MKKNNNVCSIFYDRFNILKSLTSCPKQALLLDQFIFWWQDSTYRLKNSEHAWFMRPYAEIANDTGLSLSTVKNYIKEFEEAGFIERRTTFCAKNPDNSPKTFEVKKGTYIRITEKLLALLKYSETQEKQEKPNTENTTNDAESSFKKQKNTIEKPNFDLSLYTDQHYPSFSNSISEADTVNNGKKQPVTQITYRIEKQIGERITEEVKTIIKGMLFNVQHKHNVQLSDPEQIFAEIIFSIMNPQQFKNAQSMTHKINIISSLLRQKRWCTPKGFYNHWDIGQHFKDKKEMKKQKEREDKIKNALPENPSSAQISEMAYRMSYYDETEKTQPIQTNTIPLSSQEALHEIATTPELTNEERICQIDRLIQEKNQELERQNILLNSDNLYRKIYERTIHALTNAIAHLYEEKTMLLMQLEQCA